jgi:bifunctional DNA-binding transcriptional regulator/antitoxin component of YhaV-PrlF toxin-antitoxin module
MIVTIPMDRAGRVVLPRAVRERFGLAGVAHQLELVENPDGILLRPVGADVPVTRDASGWVVFHSDPDGVAARDPVTLVDEMRARRIREVSDE